MTISLDFQHDWPVFVRTRYKKITWKGKEYTYQDHLPWRELNIPEDVIRNWFKAEVVYHDTELEKQTKIGDRLSEFDQQGLDKLVDAINVVVKRQTNSTNEFQQKKCKKSKIADKQRGLIRSFLRVNRWIEDEFYEIRDKMLEN